MDTKKLKELGLNDEQVKEIMSDFGKQLNSLKAENDNLKTSIKQKDEKIVLYEENLKKFKDVDINGYEEQIKILEQQLKENEKKYNDEISNRDFNDMLEANLKKAKAKNDIAVKALLDIDALKASKNQKEDLNKMLEDIKSENEYLFENDEPINNPIVKLTTTQEPTKDSTNALRQAMGLKPIED